MPSMKTYKEELDRLSTVIESMSKCSTQYTLSMKGKSTFNTIGPMSQGVWILNLRATDHMIHFLYC